MLNNLKVRTKILVLSVVMCLLLVLIAGFGYSQMNRLNQNLKSMYHDNLKTVELLNDSRAQQRAIEADLYAIMLNDKNPELQKKKLEDINTRKEKFNVEFTEVKKVKMEQAELEILANLEKSLEIYRNGREQVIQLALAGKQEEAISAFNQISGPFEDFQKDLISLANYSVNDAENALKTNQDQYERSRVIFIGAVLLAILFAILSTVLVSRSIVIALKQAVGTLKTMATGDFSVKIPESMTKRKDEIGDLTKALSVMQQSVDELLISVSQASESIEKVVLQVTGNIEELNSDVQGVSATTEELAASMEETAASAEEMSATSQEMERAVHAIAEKAQGGAERSVVISDKAKDVMLRSEESQKKTAEMVKETGAGLKSAIEKAKAVEEINVLADSIKQITDQTNLLALNAAIEAARAGEAGKGFSVVADEIRKLAQDSKEAVTKIQNTTEIIMRSVEELSRSSQVMLGFVETRVMEDYQTLVKTGEEYNEDAIYYKDFSTDLSATTEELLASITDVLRTIEGVTRASSEGAEGTSDIASRSTGVTEKSSDILHLAERAKADARKLEEELEKFKI